MSSISEDFSFVEIVENIKILASNGLFTVEVKDKAVLKFANKNDDDIKIGNIDSVDMKGSVIGLRYKASNFIRKEPTLQDLPVNRYGDKEEQVKLIDQIKSLKMNKFHLKLDDSSDQYDILLVDGEGNLVYDIDMGSDTDGNFVRSEMVTVILKDADGNEIDRMAEPILKSEFEKLSADFTLWFIGDHIELTAGDLRLVFAGAVKINEIDELLIQPSTPRIMTIDEIGFGSAIGYCRSHNDPHIQTFDNVYYDVYGNCRHTLVQVDDGNWLSPPFSIQAQV